VERAAGTLEVEAVVEVVVVVVEEAVVLAVVFSPRVRREELAVHHGKSAEALVRRGGCAGAEGGEGSVATNVVAIGGGGGDVDGDVDSDAGAGAGVSWSSFEAMLTSE